MRALPSVLLLSALSACGEPVVITDNVVTEFVGAKRVDELAPRLVEGAVFVLTADRRGRRDNMNAWQIVSSNPDVLRLVPVPPDPEVDDDAIRYDAVALAPGEVEITVLDDEGAVRDAASIVVQRPDELRFYSRVHELAGAPLQVGVEAPPQVVVGGEGTFEVRYFAEGERLYGLAPLAGLGAEGVLVGAPAASLGEDHQYISLSAEAAGPQQIQLVINGVEVGRLDVSFVEPYAVASVHLDGDDEAEAEPGDSLSVIALTTDAAGAPIFGSRCVWTVGEAPITGEGERLGYTYNPDHERRVRGDCDGVGAEIVVHGEDLAASLSSSVGCSVVSGGAASLGGLVAAGLALLRRRRAG
ncbi:MAG: hypothetical protein RIT28_201 [Pseudomonadota bacterium]